MSRRTFAQVLVFAVAALLMLFVPLYQPPLSARQGNDCRTFRETGKTVCGRFLSYWQEHGGLMQQGFPISDVLNEVSELDGKSYAVQYFERAVFEHHPENRPPYDVLLSHLGTFQYKRKYQTAGQLSPTRLKYRLIDTYGGTVRYCDRDYWPVGGPEIERQRARQWLEQADKESEQFKTILQRNNLASATNLSEQQILAIYRDYKKLNEVRLEREGDRYKFGLTASGDKAAFYEVGEVIGVEGYVDLTGSVTSATLTRSGLTCPKCLAGSTLISTPGGQVAVKDLKEGMAVWTADKSGARQLATVVKTGSVPSSPNQQIVHLTLSDGRSLFASAGHPTADGRFIGSLKPGDAIDGAQVVEAKTVLYNEAATYDILPSGDTGSYWANGILIGSTLLAPQNEKR